MRIEAASIFGLFLDVFDLGSGLGDKFFFRWGDSIFSPHPDPPGPPSNPFPGPVSPVAVFEILQGYEERDDLCEGPQQRLT